MDIESTFIERIRRRPGMYIMAPDQWGAAHIYGELTANVIDEFLAGRATQLSVQVEGARLVVQDDGRGFPVDVPHESGISLAEHYLTQSHDSPTADRHAPHVHRSLFGVGVVIPNVLSSSFTLETVTPHGAYHLRYSRGQLQEKKTIDNPFARGTRIELTLDDQIFDPGTVFPRHFIRRDLFEAAHLFPGLTIHSNQETFYSREGLVELAEFELPPDASDVRRFGFQAGHDQFQLSIACVGRARRPVIRSWANGTRTPQHGSHLTAVVNVLKRLRWRPASVLVSIILGTPQFAVPTRARLHMPQLVGPIADLVEPPLRAYLDRQRTAPRE